VPTPKSGFEYPVHSVVSHKNRILGLTWTKTSKLINFVTNNKTCNNLNICYGNKAVHAIVIAKYFGLQISNKLN
jgi:hypothetical protein